MFRSKYKAKPTNGFPSRLENAVHELLLMREKRGEIRDIKRQQGVVLRDCQHCGTRISWKVDFSFVEVESGSLVFCEAKGVKTADYKKKLKLWRKAPPHPLEIWEGSWQRPKLAERIE